MFRGLQTLVLMCGCALSVMLLTLAVVLPTPHDYSGTIPGGYTAMFYSFKKGSKGSKKGSVPFKHSLERTHMPSVWNSSPHHSAKLITCEVCST